MEKVEHDKQIPTYRCNFDKEVGENKLSLITFLQQQKDLAIFSNAANKKPRPFDIFKHGSKIHLHFIVWMEEPGFVLECCSITTLEYPDVPNFRKHKALILHIEMEASKGDPILYVATAFVPPQIGDWVFYWYSMVETVLTEMDANLRSKFNRVV